MIINNIYNRDFINRMESILPKNKFYYHFDLNQQNFKEVIRLKDELADNVNLLIDCAMEGFSSIVDSIYNVLVNDNQISEDRIYLVSGATDIKDIVLAKSKQYNRKPFYSIWMREFEHFVSYRLANKQKPIIKSEFKKSFLCLNRRWRLHRPVFFSLLAQYDCFKYGYVSLDNCEIPTLDWDKFYGSIMETHNNDKEITDYLTNNFDYLKSITPMLLDVESSKLSRPYELQPEVDIYYENSYFSVVTETNYYVNEEKYTSVYGSICEATRFLTEKTFKPMAYLHPFVLVSTPNMLSLLRELGYKTFSPCINEDYDTEIDDGKRFLKIITEVKRLATLNDNERNEFIKNTQPICEHNFTLLQSRYKELFDPKLTIDFRS